MEMLTLILWEFLFRVMQIFSSYKENFSELWDFLQIFRVRGSELAGLDCIRYIFINSIAEELRETE